MILKPEFLDGDTPLAEYPRPQFKRDSFFNLNGSWDYAITKSPEFVKEFDGKILVPYSPETAASGVEKQLKKDEFLHYHRTFTLPNGFLKDRVLLNVGACDQTAKVYLNGEFVGSHEGGYTAFSIELKNVKEGENHLYLVVTDNADSDVYGRGKQRYKRGGIWYTAQSGIWQTVFLESVPNDYLKSIKIYPDIESMTLRLVCEIEGEKSAYTSIIDENGVVSEGETNGGEVVLDAKECKKWTIESPHLYILKIRVGDDEVESYFGMRAFSLEDVGGSKFMAINKKPTFFNGLLDQGYFKDGLYTPPSNKAMYDEILAAKELGFNMLRKHIKVEPMLWYYYCDILGVAVWQDMINGGGAYPNIRIILGPFVNLRLKDTNFKSMRRANPLSREFYLKEAKEMMDQLFNCVSLCLWTPFNEGWGQFDSVKIHSLLKEYDPTRLYDHASGWQDMGAGDVDSHHIYFKKIKLKKVQDRALAVTEFGGYSFPLDGHVFSPKKFGYRSIKDQNALTLNIENLFYKEVIPCIKNANLSASVYTQVSDVEDEINGLFTFDRVLKVDKERIKNMNAAVFKAFDEVISSKDNK